MLLLAPSTHAAGRDATVPMDGAGDRPDSALLHHNGSVSHRLGAARHVRRLAGKRAHGARGNVDET